MRPLAPFFFAALFLISRAFAGNAPYRNAVLSDNPLTYWQLDEAAGNATASDAAGTPQSGTFENVTLGQTSAFPNLGTCGSFNGANSRVVTPFDASFNLGSGNFSVELWYRTSVTNRGDLYTFKSSGDFGIFANNSGSGSIGGWHNAALPSYTTTLNAWHHVVYTRSGTTITLYVDGVARATGTDSQAMSSNASIIIGSNTGAYWFNGLIDEVAYYNTALGADRVLAHYNAAQQAATPPVVTNNSATNVYATTATLGATVTDTGGEPPAVTIFYGSSDGGTTPAAWTSSISLGAQSGSATGDAIFLAQNKTHYFRARAVNSAGTAWAASSNSFTTGAASAPTVQNLSPTNITGNSANLRGQITATGNQPPSVTIYYGTSDGGTTPGAWTSSVTAPGTQAGAFIVSVSGLTPLTTYYYRCFAQNPGGSAWAASAQSFATPAATSNGVVINELHIAEDDATIHSEFIELYNAGTSSADLSGWYFDKGINYTFPAGTTLAAGAYLIVCEDPATIQSRYSVSGGRRAELAGGGHAEIQLTFQ